MVWEGSVGNGGRTSDVLLFKFTLRASKNRLWWPMWPPNTVIPCVFALYINKCRSVRQIHGFGGTSCNHLPCSPEALQPCSPASLEPCSPAAPAALQACSPAALQACSPPSLQPSKPAALKACSLAALHFSTMQMSDSAKICRLQASIERSVSRSPRQTMGGGGAPALRSTIRRPPCGGRAF